MNPPPPERIRELPAGPQRTPARAWLEATTSLRVRFHEVDSMRVVWHGHYVAYFEEGRRAFGRRYDLDYPVFFAQQVTAPVVQLRLDYLAPVRVADELEITTRLWRSESVKLEFTYELRRCGERKKLATGSSVQVFTTPAGELLLQWPPFMLERFQQWEHLWQHP